MIIPKYYKSRRFRRSYSPTDTCTTLTHSPLLSTPVSNLNLLGWHYLNNFNSLYCCTYLCMKNIFDYKVLQRILIK